MAPNKWKRAVLKCFLRRAHRLCSTKELFDKEVTNIKRIFESNGYPNEYITATTSAFIKEIDDNIKLTKKPPEEVAKVSIGEKKVYMVLPYIGKCSQKLYQRIRKEMAEHGLILVSAFRTTKVQSYFSLKMKTPPLFKTDVVYRFECPCDKGTQYIGETERQFFVRVNDHCTPSTNASSAVFDHISQCEPCQKSPNIVEQFTIIHQCTKTDILSQETLYIKRYRPSLNIQLGPYKGCRVTMSIFA